MRYRRLGSTGVRVSMLGLGTMPFGTDTDDVEAARIVDRCLEVGINHFDCADVYGGGRAEELLGRLLAPHRDDVVVATKLGFPTGEGVNDQGASALHIGRAVEASLRRLGTDRVDVLHLHRFDHRADLDHTFRTLDAMVSSGKVLYLGVSNFAAWQAATALGRCALRGWAPISVMQPMYNLVKRQVEVELLPFAAAESIAVLPYGPLAGGLLSGKYGDRPESVVGRLTTNEMYKARYRPEDFEVATGLAGIAAEAGVHPATLAVAWVAANPAVTAPLIGGRTLEQLEPSLAAADLELGDDLRARISALVPEPPPATDRSEERASPGEGGVVR
jgi:aryl-alcohol dehydrogenase-like predicted oxidoreductase